MTTKNIKAIADQIGVTPADALDLCRAAGILEYWHEGRKFRAHPQFDELADYLSLEHRHSPVPELEFTATVPQMAAILVSEIEQVLSDDAVALSNANGPDDPNVRRSRGLLRMLAAA